MNQLEALSRWSTVVADTGDFHQIAKFQPRDATTNPTLILKAAKMSAYRPLIDEVMDRHKDAPLDEVTDHLLVRFGTAILSLIPGRVSTEVDARLSFDTDATVARAERIVQAYQAAGVDTEKRLLIKIAATWEGIQAAAILEKQGIHCNLTLVFSLCQAVACAHAGVTLISPFVGRIYDWHKKAAGARWNEATYEAANDPGVQSVRDIFDYYKRHDIKTEIMGASFRNVGQITALAGCDLLTISPQLLEELSQREDKVHQMLDAQDAKDKDLPTLHFGEAEFRYAVNADAMANDNLTTGIRGFCADAAQLEALLDTFSDPVRIQNQQQQVTYYYARLCRTAQAAALKPDPAVTTQWQRSDSDLLDTLRPLVEAGNQVYGKGSHWIELRHSTDPDLH